VISLPVFPEMTLEERTTVANAVIDFVHSAAQLPPGQRRQQLDRETV